MQFLFVLMHFGAAVLLSCVANWVGLRPWRRAANAHWTERNRLLWPARVTAVTNILAIPLLLDSLHRLLIPGSSLWWLPCGLAACSGALVGSFPFERALYPQIRFAEWATLAFAGWSLKLGLYVALLIGIVLMPPEPGWPTVWIAGGYLALYLAVQFGFGIRFFSWTNVLRPAPERLCRIVRETCSQSGIVPPRLWSIAGPQAQAQAYPTTGDLAFSEQLLAICSDQEIAAICQHELAHLCEGKASTTGRVLGALYLFPFLFLGPVGHLWAPGILVLFLLVWALYRFSRWQAHRLEQRADQVAVRNEPDESTYARALEKLYVANHLPAVNSSGRQTHPHLYDRLISAGMTPEYPRPARPGRLTWIGWIYVYAVWILFGVCMGQFLTGVPVK